LLIAVEAGGQGVMMAPTEILARQHMANLAPLAAAAGVRLEILTGRDKGAERAAKLGALARGEIDILVGTHAVFQKGVEFADLRLAIVDEQHRFGVAQRLALGAKGRAVDVLVMTATPIPRSLSLAQYGDMDVSILWTKSRRGGRRWRPRWCRPGGWTRWWRICARDRRGAAGLLGLPAGGRKRGEDLTAAEERFRRLRAALGDEAVGLVHGQMPPAEKDAAMAASRAGETRCWWRPR
jgi:ATP-dependent DNA helicase RecG